MSNKVLEMLGKLPDTVEGGKIIRDGEGRATGVFVRKTRISRLGQRQGTGSRLILYAIRV